MADNFVTNAASGGVTFASDDNTGVHFPYVKMVWGADGTFNLVTSANPVPVSIIAALPAGTNNIGDVDVLSLPALPAGANNIGDVDVLTLPALPAGTNNIGDVDVLTLPAATNAGAAAKTSDYDSGAGTDTVTMFGLALPASGGAVQGGTSANPLRMDPTGTTVQPVSGTVTANLAAGVNNIGDVDVLSLPSIPAGANNIGDVDVLTLPALPAGTNNIGDVDVLTLPALPAGTNNIGDVDVLTLPALPAGTNNIGDVDVLTLPATTNAGATAKVTDYDTGAGTDNVTMLGIALPGAGGAVQGGTASNPVRTDPTGTTTQPVSGTVGLAAGVNNIGDVDVLSLPALPAGANNIGDVDVLTLPALPAGTNNIGDVDVLTLPALPAGTNNIGDVDVLTLPALPAGTNNIGDVDVLTQPARVATTDNIGAALMTNVIHNGVTALTPKFAIIDAATLGENTLVASVTSKKIRVLAAFLVAAGTVIARFESGAAGTALSGQMNLVANSGFTLPFNPLGWFETAVTTLLNLELSAAISVDGCLVYVEV